MSFRPDRAKSKLADGWAAKLANEIRTRCRQADRAKDLLHVGFRDLLAAFFLAELIHLRETESIKKRRIALTFHFPVKSNKREAGMTFEKTILKMLMKISFPHDFYIFTTYYK